MVRKAWVVWLAIALVACSFGMQGPPPGHQQMNQFECSESIARPVADIVGGLFLGGILFVAAALSSSWGSGGEPSTTTGLLTAATVGTVVLFGSSATTGFNKVGQCHAAKRELAARLAVGDTLAPIAVPQAVASPPATTPVGATSVAAPPAAGPPGGATTQGQAATADSGLRRAPTIEISGSRDTLVVGARLQLLASARSASGTPLANLVYRWTSSNDATATVGLAGRVTAAAPGLVTITAHFGTVTTSVNIVIVPR